MGQGAGVRKAASGKESHPVGARSRIVDASIGNKRDT